jgi:hypothetical protein
VTKDQQIQEALKLLDPPAAEREECLHEIHRALGRVENFTAFARSSRASRSKKGGLLPYHAALRRFLKQPPAPPRRDGSRNKAAAAAAYDLLTWRGHNPTVTREGTWEELARILAGDRTVDLFEHLRKFKQNPGPIVEKVRVDGEGIHYRLVRPQPDIKSSRQKSDK